MNKAQSQLVVCWSLENNGCEKNNDNSPRAQVKSNRLQSANVQMCVNTLQYKQRHSLLINPFTYFLLTFFIRGLVANWVHTLYSTSAKTCM